MKDLLEKYRSLLASVDAWFARCRQLGGTEIRCAEGCAGCCRGLFDISLLDARLLQEGVAELAPTLREAALERCRSRLGELEARWPGFAPPYILNVLPDEEWTEMPEEDETPCPLLGADGRCLVYASRPLLCRLHGLPNIDRSGESFSDRWCTLNFPGADPLRMKELRWEFRAAFTAEMELFGAFTARLCGRPLNELDTFIPTALLIDFAGTDWLRLPLPSLAVPQGDAS